MISYRKEFCNQSCWTHHTGAGQKRSEILEYQYYLHRQLKPIVENFQKYEKKYAQKENFGKFKQEVQKEIDFIIKKSVELQKIAKENPNDMSITVRGDPSQGWDIKMSSIATRVNLLSHDEIMNEAFGEAMQPFSIDSALKDLLENPPLFKYKTSK